MDYFEKSRCGKMGKYLIGLEYTKRATLIVEADDADEAEQLAYNDPFAFSEEESEEDIDTWLIEEDYYEC